MEHQISAPSLLHILHSLIGKVVRINKGPESILGKLVAIRSNYVVVEPVDRKHPRLEDKPPFIFYQIHHIKSIEEEKLPPLRPKVHGKKRRPAKRTTGC
ncbi:hypothetical protein CVV65_15440 [Kyrpidia spormannii]|uniref:Uncharacterized protein n=1 Tax=Kyrpidia spormannii TaxID=2055160 RepID=A0A2K8N9X7_9BACL|nr:hypothetical protein [Kyrpidia spormannii]ATY86148.1 hypothetical protein CVV65_15440 [Kyrpidia spormannii]